MKRLFMLFIGSLFLHSCLSSDSQPICSTLQNIVDSFIINHPNGDVIMIHVDRKDNYDFLYINNSYGYSQEDMDGYWFYKSKLITYFQSDSIDRSSIINLKQFSKYVAPIKGYNDIYEVTTLFEPSEEVYLVRGDDDIIKLNDESAPKLKFRDITQCNVITNNSLNELLNNFIENTMDALYELKFYMKFGKQYVSIRGMHYYDKDKYDGFFYRDGYPIVIYGLENSNGILTLEEIEKPKEGIPNRKYHELRSKFTTYPYPLSYELLPNGKLRELEIGESFPLITE